MPSDSKARGRWPGRALCGSAALLAVACVLAGPPAGAVAAPARADVAVQVSFDPAATVRLRGQRFVSQTGADVGPLNDLLARRAVMQAERVLGTSEADVDAKRGKLQAAGKSNVPDLNRHYRLVVEDGAERDRLLAELRGLEVVDVVIPEPEPAPPPATPSFTSLQRFAGAAPVGISASALAGRPGGRGQQTKIIDIEYSWNAAHEDLAPAAAPAAAIPNGTPLDPFSDPNHGTAVLGLLIGTANEFGITGLAPAGAIGMVNSNSTAGWTLPSAVNLAHQRLQPGDVMLLEQQVSGLQNGLYVAPEYWPAVYDAIRLATLDGIIVIEPAGNGGVNLDDPGYGSPFPRGMPDSGAIIVGAGSGDCSQPANARLPFSTYGSRVDVQGWGQCVATTGYGALFNGGPNALYTQSFSGTSSASAVVAAAAALYSSVFQAEAGAPPSPRHVRARLMSTGTPQGGTGGRIGPLPDLVAATTGYDAAPPSVVVSSGPSGPTSDATPTFQFAASERGSSFECRVVGMTSFVACTSPYTPAALPDGAHTVEVRAIDAASNTGAAAARGFVVDTVAPTVSISAGPSGVTGDATPTFEFAASEPGASFECRIAGVTSFAACSSPHTPAPLTDGAHTFEVRATDAAQNTGQPAARAFTLVSAAVPPTEPEPDPDPVPPPVVVPAPIAEQPSEPAAVAASGSPALQPSPRLLPVLAPTIGPASRMVARVARGGTVRLSRPSITCPNVATTCTVTAQATRLTGGAPIATARLLVRPGTSATVRLKLTKTGRALLQRRGRLVVKVRITARHAGTATSRTVQVTLRR